MARALLALWFPRWSPSCDTLVTRTFRLSRRQPAGTSPSGARGGELAVLAVPEGGGETGEGGVNPRSTGTGVKKVSGWKGGECWPASSTAISAPPIIWSSSPLAASSGDRRASRGARVDEQHEPSRLVALLLAQHRHARHVHVTELCRHRVIVGGAEWAAAGGRSAQLPEREPRSVAGVNVNRQRPAETDGQLPCGRAGRRTDLAGAGRSAAAPTTHPLGAGTVVEGAGCARRQGPQASPDGWLLGRRRQTAVVEAAPHLYHPQPVPHKRHKGQKVLAVEPPLVELLGRAIGGEDELNAVPIDQQLEQPPQHHRVRHISHLHLGLRRRRRRRRHVGRRGGRAIVLCDRGRRCGRSALRGLAVRSCTARLCSRRDGRLTEPEDGQALLRQNHRPGSRGVHRVEALVDIDHQLVEVHPVLGPCVRARLVEQVHQHGLAAAHRTMNVDTACRAAVLKAERTVLELLQRERGSRLHAVLPKPSALQAFGRAPRGNPGCSRMCRSRLVDAVARTGERHALCSAVCGDPVGKSLP
eukprot:scaffold10842_cov104-Isochrysis_galbana.AAC.3